MTIRNALQPRVISTNVSAPFSFAPSQSWDGNDGQWSTFIIRVGTPAQDFRILPATNGQEVWVPDPQGCTSKDPSNCGNLRGIEPFKSATSDGFQTNQSSTWAPTGTYDLVSERNLKYTGNGRYGFDTVGLGVQGSGGPTLLHQVVAGLADKGFFLGVLGLGPKPANFSGYSDPIPSFMQSMVNQDLIPSLSFGFTAGAKYRVKQALGSLTLGGYDASRFTPNNVTFSFNSDDSRSLLVGVQSITASNTLRGTVNALSTGIYSLIDSTVPHVWLPIAACQVLESAFGLEYDNATDLYVVNDTVHAQLQKLNPSVTFKLSNVESGGDGVDIVLPYAAFDLQATYPIYQKNTNYFPLRRAANDTQFTLGRTFLQEAYITVNYEQFNFSVAQAVFQDPNPQRIVAIPSANSAVIPNSGASSHKINIGGIVAIILGSFGIIFFITIYSYLFHRKRQQRKLHHESPSEPAVVDGDMRDTTDSAYPNTTEWKHELPSDMPVPPREIPYDSNMHDTEVVTTATEIQGRELDRGGEADLKQEAVHELAGDEWMVEMPSAAKRRD